MACGAVRRRRPGGLEIGGRVGAKRRKHRFSHLREQSSDFVNEAECWPDSSAVRVGEELRLEVTATLGGATVEPSPRSLCDLCGFAVQPFSNVEHPISDVEGKRRLRFECVFLSTLNFFKASGVAYRLCRDESGGRR